MNYIIIYIAFNFSNLYSPSQENLKGFSQFCSFFQAFTKFSQKCCAQLSHIVWGKIDKIYNLSLRFNHYKYLAFFPFSFAYNGIFTTGVFILLKNFRSNFENLWRRIRKKKRRTWYVLSEIEKSFVFLSFMVIQKRIYKKISKTNWLLFF